MSVDVSWAEVEVEVQYQNLYPTSDITLGSWIDSPLHEKLAEPSTTQIISSAGTSYTELALDDPTSVGAGSVSIYINTRKTTSDASTLVISLMENTTLIATWTITDLNTVFSTYRLILTDVQVAAITNWANLRVRIAHPEGS
ncbi:MAG: hypothetical protein LC687_07060 [Actinobacteria bacterium]|nr:hypothetical protein [Actinomycetota bacterium]